MLGGNTGEIIPGHGRHTRDFSFIFKRTIFMDKVPHVVFRVLNFLKNFKSSSLLPIDKLILIMLASHSGPRGIFPSLNTLAEEIGTDYRHLRRRLKHLETLGIITVDKKLGRSSRYHFADLSTDLGSTDPQSNIYHPGSTDPHTQGLQTLYPGSTDPLISKDQIKRRERRARETRSPLSDSFSPDEKAKAICIEKGLDIDHVFSKFKAHCKSAGKQSYDWNAELEKFVLNERALAPVVPLPTAAKPVTKATEPAAEVVKCEGCHHNVDYCRCHLKPERRANAQMQLGQIMKKLGKKLSKEG